MYQALTFSRLAARHYPQIKFDRFGVEPRRERLFAFTDERVRGQGNDWDVAGLRIALEPSCGFPEATLALSISPEKVCWTFLGIADAGPRR